MLILQYQRFAIEVKTAHFSKPIIMITGASIFTIFPLESWRCFTAQNMSHGFIGKNATSQRNAGTLRNLFGYHMLAQFFYLFLKKRAGDILAGWLRKEGATFKDTDKGRNGLRRQLLKLRREGTKGIEVYAPSVQDLDDEPFF